MAVTAQYHGECAADCGEPIVPGQRIENDGEDWRHTSCGELPKTAPCVCEKCMLVHAGECF